MATISGYASDSELELDFVLVEAGVEAADVVELKPGAVEAVEPDELDGLEESEKSSSPLDVAATISCFPES